MSHAQPRVTYDIGPQTGQQARWSQNDIEQLKKSGGSTSEEQNGKNLAGSSGQGAK